MDMRIAIDTGGTFTDCVYVVDGKVHVLKLPSTPANPEAAVVKAVTQIASGARAEIRHGTTVGTNALLERKGARVAFIATAGFEDTIEIGRQARPKLYDLFFSKEPPLVDREMRFGVPRNAIGPPELEQLRDAVAEKRPESIAISLLFSFANPANERAVARALSELGVPLSVSHEILPEFREYERASTVVMNAYLAPKMQGYLARLDCALRGCGSELHVMQSSGGILPAAMAMREPVRTILSGPAGGVVGALAVAQAAALKRILTFDMGGTSTDVALVSSDVGLRTTSEFQIAGMPVGVPMLDIHTVGAGGGSLASFDRGGALKVGPESAGADPGPICYGRGEQPTVTDANLLLGRLSSGGLLGGVMKLDRERARSYFERAKGRLPDIETLAEGIIRVADSHMEKALRKISVEQGQDPREYTLVSFGGAGPLHACALARALRIPKVLVPEHPGALSAYGILLSDVVRDYSRTIMLKPDDPAIARHIEELAAHENEGVAVPSVDMRYAGQGFELNVAWTSDDDIRPRTTSTERPVRFVEQFHKLHEQRYGYADRARPVQVVNARVRMIAETPRIEPRREAIKNGDGKQALTEERVYQRDQLHAGDCFQGPAVVVEYSATTYVPDGARVKVDELRNLLIEV